MAYPTTAHNNRPHNHSSHSHMVSAIGREYKFVCGLHSKQWDVHTENRNALSTPFGGYVVRVSFSTVPGIEGMVLIRSTNWKCEDEPKGWMAVEEARRLWRSLTAAGFIDRQAVKEKA